MTRTLSSNASNGRSLSCGYGTSDALPDCFSQIQAINDGASPLTSCTYDGTTAPEPGAWGTNFGQIYDAWNRLVEVNTADGSTLSTVAVYAYDGMHRRTTKTTVDGTQGYCYSKYWQVLEARLEDDTSMSSSSDFSTSSSSGSPVPAIPTLTQFVWGLRGVDDLIQRQQTLDADESTTYALRDGMHVTSICNAEGTMLERYGYDAFGTTLFMTASFAPTANSQSAYAWETTFCSYQFDDETGFYQVRFRYLHPALGRWISRDPIGLWGGTNLYAYCDNYPATFVDPTGLQAWLWIAAAVALGISAYGTYTALQDAKNFGNVISTDNQAASLFATDPDAASKLASTVPGLAASAAPPLENDLLSSQLTDLVPPTGSDVADAVVNAALAAATSADQARAQAQLRSPPNSPNNPPTTPSSC